VRGDCKTSDILAHQGKRDHISLLKKEVVKCHGESPSPSLLDTQLKNGIEAHLGMPTLSPFSVNFKFLHSFSHNFLDLNMLKNIPSFLLALDPPKYSPPGPPISSLSFGASSTPPDPFPPSQSQDSSLLSNEEYFCYNLRFWSIPFAPIPSLPLVILGLNPSHASQKGRGIKYLLSKPQSRASMDVVARRQLSISRELRANPSPTRFPK